MDSDRRAFCLKKLKDAQERLAFLEYFEKSVSEFNRERLSELKKVRQAEVGKWKRELDKS